MNSSKLGEKPEPTPPEKPERDRLRDIIVVIITYPLTPTEKTGDLAAKKPWLEFVSLLLKVALAAYALYEGVRG
ncbi:MAG: hypothetical protein AAF840_12180 [Bacteroidota bacterium]